MALCKAFSRLITFLAILFLSGCHNYYLFGPVKYGSSHHFEYKDNTRGGLMGDGEGALSERGAEGVLVGWEHFSQDDRVHNHIYRGAVQFNVAPLSEPPSKTVTKATLSYSVETGERIPPEGFIESCATRLYLANGPWHGIPNADSMDTIPGTFVENLPSGLLGSRISVDVTSIVKDWVSGKKPNEGFVLGASREESGLPENNEKCWTFLSDFTLRIDYTKP